MKQLQRFLLLAVLFQSFIANGQVWKQYSDSARVLFEKNKIRQALELCLKVDELLKVDSLNTGSYASNCNSLGILYAELGEYEKAGPRFLLSKEIREKTHGKLSDEYASSCNSLGNFYMLLGQFDKVKPFYEEAMKIRETIYGKEHPDYAASCNNLGALYEYTGQYTKAEPLYYRAKEIWSKNPGKDHPHYASCCDNLGILYMQLGQFDKAEIFYIEAKDIREKLFGHADPVYAISCNNLADLYRRIGQYSKAKLLYLQAKEIRGKAFGTGHVLYAGSLNNLAILLEQMGEYGMAEPLLAESKQIKEKTVGKGHPDYATSCYNLGQVYEYMGRYDKAESMYLESKQVREKLFGNAHPDYAESCNVLAGLYERSGKYAQARDLFETARQIREKSFGKQHPSCAESYKNLANLAWVSGNYVDAGNHFSEALYLQAEQINRVFQFTSESEKQTYLAGSKMLINQFFSFSLSGENNNKYRPLAYNSALSDRNMILSSLEQLRWSIQNSGDTAIKNKYDEWMSAREQIYYWSTKPVTYRVPYAKDLEGKAEAMEKELARLSLAFKREQGRKEITWRTVLGNLKENEAAIEFVEFNYYDARRLSDSVYYIALVLRKDRPEPELIPLFEKKQLDKLLKIYSGTSAGQTQLNFLYRYIARSSKAGQQSLYDLIWKPIENKLQGIKTVYFAPAGSLFKISFAALPAGNDLLLSDKYQLVQLTTTAAVVDNSNKGITGSDKIVLYGGVEYDVDSTGMKLAALKSSGNGIATRSLPPDLTREVVQEFSYLGGTARELHDVNKLAQQYKYTVDLAEGKNATEESFKLLAGSNAPVVLHIATHGFFFPDPGTNKKDNRAGGVAVFRQSDNPLIRSGLALAGANNAWKGKPVAGVEDGILTAYEVSNMYLPNTKLAVLSACETGLGDIQGSEGVYGLQRAFKMAGVENLVMSLWKVPDGETAEFMQQFYKNLFAKQTIQEAFYNAQTIMKNKYRKEPYKWAAWVLIR